MCVCMCVEDGKLVLPPTLSGSLCRVGFPEMIDFSLPCSSICPTLICDRVGFVNIVNTLTDDVICLNI